MTLSRSRGRRGEGRATLLTVRAQQQRQTILSTVVNDPANCSARWAPHMESLQGFPTESGPGAGVQFHLRLRVVHHCSRLH